MSARRLSDAELEAIYDRTYAESYDPDALLRMRRLVPHLAVDETMVVADFACGDGAWAEVVGPLVARYVGVDFSAAFVEVANRRRVEGGWTRAEFHLSSIEAFCAARPDTFDAGFALDFSEHVYDDQFVDLFRAIHGSLRPGAALYLHTPNRAYVLERLRASGWMNPIEGHVAVRTADHNEALLRTAGFSEVRTTYLAHYLPLPASFHGLRHLPWVGDAFRARLFQVARRGG